MKLAIVAQRYGSDADGAAERYARSVAERLGRRATVTVLTTCAADAAGTRPFPPGETLMGGVTVQRFGVRAPYDPALAARRSERVFRHRHSVDEELAWLAAEGPASPALVAHLSGHPTTYDAVLFFGGCHYQSFHGARAVASRAVLVPLADREARLGLGLTRPFLRGARAVVYSSTDEQALLRAAAGSHDLPGPVAGLGADLPPNPQPARFRQKHGVRGPFALYVGQVDEAAGGQELLDLFQAYLNDAQGRLTLLLAGEAAIEIPGSRRIRHLGALDDAERADALAGADVVLLPSRHQVVAPVAVDAWALGRPVLVTGRSDALRALCLRSNGGLFYDNSAEFVEALRAIERYRWVSGSLARSGRAFVRDHCDWSAIERKFLDAVDRVTRQSTAGAVDPLPAWPAKHRTDIPAAEDTLSTLAVGADPQKTAARSRRRAS